MNGHASFYSVGALMQPFADGDKTMRVEFPPVPWPMNDIDRDELDAFVATARAHDMPVWTIVDDVSGTVRSVTVMEIGRIYNPEA